MAKTQREFGVDMIVVMPAELFQDKDYRDLRYFYKRSYYLARLCEKVRKQFAPDLDPVFENLHGNELLPVLALRPKDSKSNYTIRIIPCAPEGLFPASKLHATGASIRYGDAESVGAHSPTPFYNTTLKAESLFQPYLRLVTSTAKLCPAYKDACVLGRVWLQQRGFGSDVARGGFGHFEWAVLVALLLSGGGRKGEPILSKSLSSSQILKATIQYLAASNLQRKLVVIGPAPSDVDAVRQSGPVLFDSARELNLLWKMTPWSANMLQQQAKWSLAALKDDSVDQFDPSFVVKVDQPFQMFDLVVKVAVPPASEQDAASDRRGRVADFSDKLYQIIKKALGDRASLLHVSIPQSKPWSVTSAATVSKSPSVMIEVAFDAVTAFRRMDLGPEAEQKKEAAKYQEFWGEKSELRRFQDGSIKECIEWAREASAGIPEEIIRYITKFHLNLDEEDLEFFGGDFASIAQISPSDSQYFQAAKEAFAAMEQELRNLDDLPLHINQVAPVCPELRYTSLRLPTGGKPVQPFDVVVSFEASGKWTDNLAANQRLKVAFLLKMGECLEESNEETKTHVGMDPSAQSTQNLAFLDIVYESGFAFRLRVRSEAEERELEMRTRNKQLERHEQAEAATTLATFRRLYTVMPLHNQTISTWCTRFSPLSGAIRLTKHWFSCHKLASHFTEELIELLVLQAFLKPYPWHTPSSAMTGFLHAMHLISRWDWPEEPLIVDHAGSITASERSAIMARFREARKQDPRFNRTVLFLADSNDTTGLAHTRDGPSRVVANQMVKLARSAGDLAKAKGVALDARALFQPVLKHYDVVIRLNPKAVKAVIRDDGAPHRASHFKNLEVARATAPGALPLAEHPVQALVRELATAYAAALVFFHGGPADLVLAAVWNPELGPRTRKGEMPCAFRPQDAAAGTLDVDRTAIVAEIARIGGDLIEKIEVRGQ